MSDDNLANLNKPFNKPFQIGFGFDNNYSDSALNYANVLALNSNLNPNLELTQNITKKEAEEKLKEFLSEKEKEEYEKLKQEVKDLIKNLNLKSTKLSFEQLFRRKISVDLDTIKQLRRYNIAQCNLNNYESYLKQHFLKNKNNYFNINLNEYEKNVLQLLIQLNPNINISELYNDLKNNFNNTNNKYGLIEKVHLYALENNINNFYKAYEQYKIQAENIKNNPSYQNGIREQLREYYHNEVEEKYGFYKKFEDFDFKNEKGFLKFLEDYRKNNNEGNNLNSFNTIYDKTKNECCGFLGFFFRSSEFAQKMRERVRECEGFLEYKKVTLNPNIHIEGRLKQAINDAIKIQYPELYSEERTRTKDREIIDINLEEYNLAEQERLKEEEKRERQRLLAQHSTTKENSNYKYKEKLINLMKEVIQKDPEIKKLLIDILCGFSKKEIDRKNAQQNLPYAQEYFLRLATFIAGNESGFGEKCKAGVTSGGMHCSGLFQIHPRLYKVFNLKSEGEVIALQKNFFEEPVVNQKPRLQKELRALLFRSSKLTFYRQDMQNFANKKGKVDKITLNQQHLRRYLNHWLPGYFQNPPLLELTPEKVFSYMQSRITRQDHLHFLKEGRSIADRAFRMRDGEFSINSVSPGSIAINDFGAQEDTREMAARQQEDTKGSVPKIASSRRTNPKPRSRRR